MKKFFCKSLSYCMFFTALFNSNANMSASHSIDVLDFQKLSDPMFSVYRNYGFKYNYLLELFESGLGFPSSYYDNSRALDNSKKKQENVNLVQSAINLRPSFEEKYDELAMDSILSRSTCSSLPNPGTCYQNDTYPCCWNNESAFGDLCNTSRGESGNFEYSTETADMSTEKQGSKPYLGESFMFFKPDDNVTTPWYDDNTNDICYENGKGTEKTSNYVLSENTERPSDYDIQNYIYDSIAELEKNIKLAKKSDLVAKQLTKIFSGLKYIDNVLQYNHKYKTEVHKNPKKKFWAITLNDDIIYFGVTIDECAYRFKLSEPSEILNKMGNLGNDYLLDIIDQALNENYESIISITNAKHLQDIELYQGSFSNRFADKNF